MLRPGMLLALSLTDTFVDTLLRTDFAIRRYPSYAGAWTLPRPDFHRLEDACFAGHATSYKGGRSRFSTTYGALIIIPAVQKPSTDLRSGIHNHEPHIILRVHFSPLLFHASIRSI